MDFHVLTPVGEALILSTDGSGRILTPLPASPPAGKRKFPKNSPAVEAGSKSKLWN